jgi:hypothetical protein
MPLLKLTNLGVRPAMETVRLHPDRSDISGRIVDAQANLDSMLHHSAQDFPQTVGAVRLFHARSH